ncbi:SDR family NAD(P)-dependent oxidoreductase [Gloeothece verrucosa]|uniref:Short-chain dehydrogenase/reductase SDR n=1 Tax=Gloeothece verrucosa (strain PCC 7822) TaxID=497965 RepID=E0UK00_GLOV7|nr:SDR family oxidoreductase [Gloeothece verrucosa]ADN14636.1 short-chain dehydrogenase/reductase SDR [Gloeothece verrucosa PCC 7822]
MGRLNQKVALITGVSSGIGAAAAKLFAAEGAAVFGVDCHTEAGEALEEELRQLGLSFHFFACDVANSSAARDIVSNCGQTYGRVDILYNNAGISTVEAFTSVSQSSLERIMAVNFMATFYLCQQVIPVMKQQGGGVIINTASELAFVAQPLFTAYCASKGAVLAFTRSLALEYAADNIRINALCPGPIDTPMLNAEFNADSDPVKARTESIATIPIGRLGRPEEIAQVALFLASDAPQLMHGASLLVDGGKTIV